MLVASLSTIPPRFDKLTETLQSLLAQSTPFAAIHLYIPQTYRRFPDWDGTLPEVPEGITIIRPQEDYGPATKILCAARDFQGQDVDIFFCDDDRFYEPELAQTLLDGRAACPNGAIVATGLEMEMFDLPVYPNRKAPRAEVWKRSRALGYRVKRIYDHLTLRSLRKDYIKPRRPLYIGAGYVDTLEGWGGVLVRPEFFDDQMYDIPKILWSVDDIWLSGHFARKGIDIWVVAHQLRSLHTKAHFEEGLAENIFDGADRKAANLACIRYMQDTYGVWT